MKLYEISFTNPSGKKRKGYALGKKHLVSKMGKMSRSNNENEFVDTKSWKLF